MAWSAYVRFDIARDVEAKRVAAEREILKLQEQKGSLSKEVEYLSNERGIEAEMRRQFDVALEDEQVVVIVEPDEDETNQSTTTYEEKPAAWYEFWR